MDSLPAPTLKTNFAPIPLEVDMDEEFYEWLHQPFAHEVPVEIITEKSPSPIIAHLVGSVPYLVTALVSFVLGTLIRTY